MTTSTATKASSTHSSRSTRLNYVSITWSMVLAALRNSANLLTDPLNSDKPTTLCPKTLAKPPWVLSTQTTRPSPANTGRKVAHVSSVTAAHSIMAILKRGVLSILSPIYLKVSPCLQCPRKWDTLKRNGATKTRKTIKASTAYPLLDKTKMPSCSWPILQIWRRLVGSILTSTLAVNPHHLSLLLSPVPSKTSKRCP